MIDLFSLRLLVQQAAEAGVANYIKHTMPASDKLKVREAQRWLATLGYKPCYLSDLIASGAIVPKRNGKGKNSPLIVSKSDIMTAITAKNIGKFLIQ